LRDTFDQVLDVVWRGPTANGIDKIEELKAITEQTKSDNSNKNEKHMQILDIFISHSSHDEFIAERLIALIRSALDIPPEKIRCTSLNGFRLPVGTTTNERLRKEIHDSKAFIALITPNSLKSTYVLFELGARWGAEKPMIPLIARDIKMKDLSEPLSAINVLNCSDAAQLHQFIDDLGDILGISSNRASVYQKCIRELIEASNQSVVHFANPADHSKTHNSNESVPGGIEARSSVLVAIWQLDVGRYSENGYKVEDVATKLKMSVPECKHYLETFVKEKKVKRVQVIGVNGGLHYSLTVDGSSFILEKGYTS
jgi:predicted transcriptional regulator